ncbi:MAG: hypothetical protein R6U98_30425 [Pirellulaceae bacterium]
MRGAYSQVVAISPNQKWLDRARCDAVRVYEVASQKAIAEFPAYWDLIEDIAFCPWDSGLLATTGRDGVIRFQDVSTFPKREKTQEFAHPQPFQALTTLGVVRSTSTAIEPFG